MQRIVWLALALVLGCDETAAEELTPQHVTIPAVEYCDPVREWPELDRMLERAVVERINDWRSQGADCPETGRFAPAPALRLSARATCASRIHAQDMASADFVGHEGSDESTPWVRLRAAGSRFAVADQVIAAGDLAPEEIVDDLWMTRPGSCAALMALEYTQVGLGWAVAPEASSHASYIVGMVERSRSALDD